MWAFSFIFVDTMGSPVVYCVSECFLSNRNQKHFPSYLCQNPMQIYSYTIYLFTQNIFPPSHHHFDKQWFAPADQQTITNSLFFQCLLILKPRKIGEGMSKILCKLIILLIMKKAEILCDFPREVHIKSFLAKMWLTTKTSPRIASAEIRNPACRRGSCVDVNTPRSKMKSRLWAACINGLYWYLHILIKTHDFPVGFNRRTLELFPQEAPLAESHTWSVHDCPMPYL